MALCAFCGRQVGKTATYVNGSIFCGSGCASNMKNKGKTGIGTGLSQMWNSLAYRGDMTLDAENLIIGAGKVALGLGGLALTGLAAGGKLAAKAASEAAERSRLEKEAQAKHQAEQARIANEKRIAAENAVVFCGNCGSKMIAKDTFCGECGTTVKAASTATTSQKTEAAKAVFETVFCPDCGSKNTSDAPFCGDCGAKL